MSKYYPFAVRVGDNQYYSVFKTKKEADEFAENNARKNIGCQIHYYKQTHVVVAQEPEVKTIRVKVKN